MNSKLRFRTCAVFLSMLLVLSTILISACSSQTNSETNSHTIRIGYQKSGPLLILKERGTLEKRLKSLGYTVKWHEFQAGPALLEALNSGSIDFGRTGDTPPIFAQASGSNLKYVATGKKKDAGAGILVKKNSSIKSLADLKGKKVGFTKGSSSHFLILQAVKKAGLEYTDIKPAFLSPGDARFAFEQGNIDAWAVWDPFLADAQRNTDSRLLVSGTGLTSDRDFFMASPGFLKNHSNIVKIVLEEIQKVGDWSNTHHKELTNLLSKVLGIDPASMKIAVERREYGVEDISKEVLKEEQSMADAFYKIHLIPKKLDVEANVYRFNEKDDGK